MTQTRPLGKACLLKEAALDRLRCSLLAKMKRAALPFAVCLLTALPCRLTWAQGSPKFRPQSVNPAGDSSSPLFRGWLSSTEKPEKPLQHWASNNRLGDLLLTTHLLIRLNAGSPVCSSLTLKASWAEEEMLQRRLLCSNCHIKPSCLCSSTTL